MGGGGCQTLLVFNFLSNNMVLWVLYFAQVGGVAQKFSKSYYYDDFFQKWSRTCRSKRVFLRPNFRVDFFVSKNLKDLLLLKEISFFC